jgi:DNA polymerase
MGKLAQLAKVKDDIITNLKCPLKDAAANLVFGKGNPDAKIMFIGEAPGANEDKQGLPFVGAAGKRLNSFLESINLTLDDCYIANILKYRPPDNRPPKPDEMERHVPYLIQQIHIIKPKVLVTLGNFSTRVVLAGFSISKMKEIDTISELHGKSFNVIIGLDKCTVIPIYHPAACIYNPKLKKDILDDFQKIKLMIE